MEINPHTPKKKKKSILNITKQKDRKKILGTYESK